MKRSILAPSLPRSLALSLSLALMLTIFSCKHELSPADVSLQAAKAYYDYLLQGKSADFVAGIYQPDSISESYRSQLVDNVSMFLAQMRSEHGGLKMVTVSHATYNEQNQTANAYLILSFQNGDTEQIVVPMICRNGLWLMR